MFVINEVLVMKKVRYKRSKGEDLVVHICNRVGRSYENRDKEGEERYPLLPTYSSAV